MAESILPGSTLPEGSTAFNARWRAVVAVDEFVESDPEAVWTFAAKWGCHRSADLRAAIGVLLVEGLLYADFDFAFPRIAALVRRDDRFAQAVDLIYWSGMTPTRSRRMKRLMAEARRRTEAFERRERRRVIRSRRKSAGRERVT